jgi:PPM family protein phosphatase
MTQKSISPWAAESTLEVNELSLTLGPVSELGMPGNARDGRAADGRVFRILEFSEGKIPVGLEAALQIEGVASTTARITAQGTEVFVLRPSPGPSLDWVFQRLESPLAVIALFESLAILFQKVHDACLAFRTISPSMFAVSAEGSISLEEPEALRKAEERTIPTLYSPPEAVAMVDAGPRSDQYSLAGLLHTLLTGREPLALYDFPSPRIFLPRLPHGVVSSLSRALNPYAANRYDSCRAFADDLRSRVIPKGTNPGHVAAAAATELGRVKGKQTPVNQDAFFIGLDSTSTRGMMLVADGISTADVGSGDLASGFVREAVRNAWEGPVGEVLRSHQGNLPNEWPKTALEAILEDANARIYSFLKQPMFVGSLGPGIHPPGSTAVLAILVEDCLTVANVGDSRLYLLRDGVMEQFTVDQDLRTEVIRSGRNLGNAEPASLGALTHSIGSFFFDNDGGIIQRKIGADIQILHLRSGDRLLFCSDGVPDCLGENHEQIMAAELGSGSDPQAIATRLCKLADEALGGDNITALVVIAEPLPLST